MTKNLLNTSAATDADIPIVDNTLEMNQPNDDEKIDNSKRNDAETDQQDENDPIEWIAKWNQKETVDFFPKDLPNKHVLKYYKVALYSDRMQKMGTRFRDLEVTFRGVENEPLNETLLILHDILENLMYALMQHTNKQDRVHFVLESSQFTKGAISIKMVSVQESSINMLMEAISRVTHSCEDFRLDSTVMLHFIHQPMPGIVAGANNLGTPLQHKETELEKDLSHKRSIISIKNGDKLCLTRGLMIGKKKQMALL